MIKNDMSNLVTGGVPLAMPELTPQDRVAGSTPFLPGGAGGLPDSSSTPPQTPLASTDPYAGAMPELSSASTVSAPPQPSETAGGDTDLQAILPLLQQLMQMMMMLIQHMISQDKGGDSAGAGSDTASALPPGEDASTPSGDLPGMALGGQGPQPIGASSRPSGGTGMSGNPMTMASSGGMK